MAFWKSESAAVHRGSKKCLPEDPALRLDSKMQDLSRLKVSRSPTVSISLGICMKLTLILALLSLVMGVAAPAACVKGVAVVASSSMMPDAIPVCSRWFFEPSIPSRERRTVENGRF